MTWFWKRKDDMDPYRKFIEEIPMAALLATCDLSDTKIICANKKHQKLTGYKNAELIGKSPLVFRKDQTDDPAIKRDLLEHHFYTGNVINYTKSGNEYSINLTIMGVIIEGRRFYCCIKNPAV